MVLANPIRQDYGAYCICENDLSNIHTDVFSKARCLKKATEYD